MRIVKKALRKLVNQLGYNISRLPQPKDDMPVDGEAFTRLVEENTRKLKESQATMAHYGCGPCLYGKGWANIDIRHAPGEAAELRLVADLTSRHPFPSDYFRFAFAEDFISSLDQAESIVFLCEAYRCLRPGGVLRLSTPGLRGVLRDHFRSSDYEGASTGVGEAYARWRLKHFYCRESLAVVAAHIGFSRFDIVEYGKSEYPELCGLDYRRSQIGLNIYAELTK